MLLAIDSGNTNTVFAVFDDNGKIMGNGAVPPMPTALPMNLQSGSLS